MKRMTLRHEPGLLVGGQLTPDKTQVKALITSIELVAHDWVTDVSEVNSNLVVPTGDQNDAHERQRLRFPQETFERIEVRFSLNSILHHRIFNGDGTG